MQKLVKGIHQFQKHVFASHKDFFERLSEGQSPETLFITCSDSRINPNLLTQTQPGELFILRNAGNIVPPYGAPPNGEHATIEFAVAALGVKDIIVCGHSHCGAVNGLLEPEKLDGLPAVAAWLEYAGPTARIIRENYAHLEGDARVTATIEENVLVQIQNLNTLPVVAEKLAKGELILHAWVYKIETGEVFTYDPAQGQFVTLAPTGFRGTGRLSLDHTAS